MKIKFQCFPSNMDVWCNIRRTNMWVVQIWKNTRNWYCNMVENSKGALLIWELAPAQIFNLFPANIWILKFFFLTIFTIKMSFELLVCYWISMNLNVGNHFDILFLAESQFQNSNVGGKQIKNLCRCWFRNKFDFIAHMIFFSYRITTHKTT